MRLFAHSLFVFFLFIFASAFFVKNVFAATSPFRSANIITTDGVTPYTNLANCSNTDGATCDRGTASSYGNLYFRDFGKYSDFGIPAGSTITKVNIKVTGKASIPAFALYVGLSSGMAFTSNCQTPSDIWTLWDLNSATIKTQTFVTNVTETGLPSAVKASCLTYDNFETKNFIFRINYTSPQNWSANIDNFEIAFDYEIAPTPTPTPTSIPTPTPTPISPPAPFLDLPWDYTGKGLTFNEAALSINSYFDHEYPLLSGGIDEILEAKGTIVKFNGFPRNKDDPYSSHDGYDYGIKAKANNGDPVLAAADGCASYNLSSAGGNAIKIDHGNYYQTRYLHLQDTGLITKETTSCVTVVKGQKIGQVGATGNVSPSGISGAHIHFGVFEDKNKDGNFEDNVPDGVTDPFGWQSKEPDPWETYPFFFNGLNRTGNKSYYLWTKKISNLDATLTSNGGVFNTERYELNFPQGSVLEDINLIIQSSPIVKVLDNLRSIGSTIIVNAFDALGNAVTDFTNSFTLTVDFSSIDLSSYNTDTIFLYSSADGVNWLKETTAVDLNTRTATASAINHLTHFALMAERLDATPPATAAVLNGQQGQENWFRSDVSVGLNPDDNGGLGADYTLYKKETGDWETYGTPLVFTTEGHHKIEFYSVDKDENIENVKSVEFDVDKTAPEANIHFDAQLQDLAVAGSDSASLTNLVQTQISKNTKQSVITDKAGNTILALIDTNRLRGSEVFNISSLAYNSIGTPVDSNKLSIRYQTSKSGAVRSFDQTFEIKGVVQIQLSYDPKTNKTLVTASTQKITVDGMKVLQVTTEKGTLKYSY